jgi:hypothetical protein
MYVGFPVGINLPYDDFCYDRPQEFVLRLQIVFMGKECTSYGMRVYTLDGIYYEGWRICP